MKLLNPTDMELTEAFAVNVAKWTFITFPYGVCPNKKHWFDSAGKFVSIHLDGRFTTSADAVLPWLEKCPCAKASFSPSYRQKKMLWEVSCGVDNPDNTMSEGSWLDTSLPRAAVMALLRAHGVEVEFTK